LPDWPLGLAWPVSILAVDGEFSRVVYEVRDLEAESADPITFVRIEGWVRSTVLVYGHEREFFHLDLQGPAPERWVQQAEGTMLFELYWEPLLPPPRLISGQREWLADWHERLSELTRAG
jgi:hypothetical protein